MPPNLHRRPSTRRSYPFTDSGATVKSRRGFAKLLKTAFAGRCARAGAPALCFDGALCQLHDESIGPELVAEHRETFETIVACIQSMKSRYRDILLYRLFSELSYAQIAAIMHMGEGAAKVLYHRARLQLQTLIMEVLSP